MQSPPPGFRVGRLKVSQEVWGEPMFSNHATKVSIVWINTINMYQTVVQLTTE